MPDPQNPHLPKNPNDSGPKPSSTSKNTTTPPPATSGPISPPSTPVTSESSFPPPSPPSSPLSSSFASSTPNIASPGPPASSVLTVKPSTLPTTSSLKQPLPPSPSPLLSSLPPNTSKPKEPPVISPPSISSPPGTSPAPPPISPPAPSAQPAPPPISLKPADQPPATAIDSSQPIPPPPPADEGGGQPKGKIQSSIFKKLIPIVAAVLGIILLLLLVFKLVLPALKGSKEPEPVTLTYWGLWEETPVFSSIISDYQTQNPQITINYQQQSHKDYRERLQSALARDAGPDIFRFHNTWVPMLKSELAPLPATVFDSAAFRSTFYPVAQKDLKLGSNIIGIPLMIDGLALYYNKDIFKNGGKSPPTSWEQLRQTAFDLTVRDESGKVQTAGIALGTTGNVEHWSDIVALMMLQNDADPGNPVGASAEDAIKFYTIFSLSDKVWNESLPNSIFAFATGKVAMIFAPSWQAHTIKEINSQIDFSIIPIPQLPGTNVAWASYWVEGVSQKSSKQEEAFKFLKFLSAKNNLVKLYTEASKTRLFGEPYSRKDLASTIENDDLVGAYITQAEKAKSFYMASRTFDNGINDKIIKYYEDAINAVNQGEDPQNVLQTVAQGVSQILSQYGITATSR